MRDGLVAQWIEQLRPKEKVVRSTRTRVTRNNHKTVGLIFISDPGARRTKFALSRNECVRIINYSYTE